MSEQTSMCGNCKHFYKPVDQGEMPECRRFPPQVIPMPVQTPQGTQMARASVFPNPQGYWLCGEFARKLSVLS